ncbi:MAG: phenylalanine--tRNA ligase subunit beta [Alphaproteobacteria bacterium]|nr:phenylalanine--tRNA ligase subunit beta [Alphaproteobacteria bacterium]
MKFTLSWLKRHLDTDASLEEIGKALTAIGLEVEEITDRAKDFAPFKVALIEAAEKHPDADKLKVCTVKTESGMQQVVCGAPNARAGMKGIFAPENTYIPGLDVTLKKTKIRGVESCGMMVSEKEMQLSDEHKGIIEVDDSYAIGTPMAGIFGLDDPVIEIALTPNRADCAGVRGIARDLAAAGLGKLKPLQTPSVTGQGASPVKVTIEDTEGCPLFLGRYIKGVKNAPSPKWLQDQLKAVGLRPISALVDITNFICLDHARPLHVYDADKLSGDIYVRTSHKNETFRDLNVKAHTFKGNELVISDEAGPQGLAGIIGGQDTCVEEDTTNIFLECAYFKPERIARTGRALSIDSDARYRFDRGVDPAFLSEAMEIFTAMVLDICGGQASEIVTAGQEPNWQTEIEYDPAYCAQLIGLDIPQARQLEILSALGFEVSGSAPKLKIRPPSWRGDVFARADIVEEIIRIEGFDKLPAVSVINDTAVPSGAETPLLTRMRTARAALAARGLQESITWSFIGRDFAAAFGANDNQIAALTLQNPISSEMDVMRPSILPTLIEAAIRNEARGYPSAALFEVGPVFAGVKPEDQSILAAGIRTGSNAARHWADKTAARPVDLYDAKADALAALAAAGAPAENAQISADAPEYYHPGRSGALRLGKNVLAYFGEIHPATLEDMDVKFPIVAFEVFLENIPEAKKKSGTEKPYLTLEPLQPLARDFAFVVDEQTPAADIIRAAKSADKTLITGAEIFDVYQGKGVEPGQKSIALSVSIQPTEQTLTDKDLEGLMARVIDAVQQKCGGVLRG